jgi:UDP-glucose 4-epimerase
VPESLADPVEAHDRNVFGAAVVLEAARRAGARRVVLASSCAVYGDDPSPVKAEGREGAPLSPYAASKAAAELVARAQAAAFGHDILCLRYFNVYGPRQRPDSPYAGVIPRFVEALAEGRAPTIFGDGRQVRDFVYVDDVVEANVRALTSPRTFRGDAVNVAGGSPVTILDLLDELRAITGRTDVQPRFEAPRPGDIRDSRADVTRLREVLGFVPSTPLLDGLAATVAWQVHG